MIFLEKSTPVLNIKRNVTPKHVSEDILASIKQQVISNRAAIRSKFRIDIPIENTIYIDSSYKLLTKITLMESKHDVVDMELIYHIAECVCMHFTFNTKFKFIVRRFDHARQSLSTF